MTVEPGNALIVSEDGNSSDSDDNTGVDRIQFEFEQLVSVSRIDFLDAQGSDTVFLDGLLMGTSRSSDSNGSPNKYEKLLTRRSEIGKILNINLVGLAALDDITLTKCPS